MFAIFLPSLKYNFQAGEDFIICTAVLSAPRIPSTTCRCSIHNFWTNKWADSQQVNLWCTISKSLCGEWKSQTPISDLISGNSCHCIWTSHLQLEAEGLGGSVVCPLFCEVPSSPTIHFSEFSLGSFAYIFSMYLIFHKFPFGKGFYY